jgi:hypothetical protein
MVAAPLGPLPLDLPTSPHTSAGQSDTLKLPVWAAQRANKEICDLSEMH